MANFTWIPDCDSHRPAVLDLFISSVACSTMAFTPFRNSDHVVVSVSIDFPSNSKGDALLHPIAYENSLRQFHDERIPLNMVLLLQLLNFVSGSSFELM